MPEWDALPPIAKLIVQFSVASVIIWGVYLFLVKPRKGRDNEERSPIFVLGSSHDREIQNVKDEADRRVQALEALIKSEREQHVSHLGEWRALREEERARAIEERARATEADERLRENSALIRDLATNLNEARLDLARAVALLGNLPADRRSGTEGDSDA